MFTLKSKRPTLVPPVASVFTKAFALVLGLVLLPPAIAQSVLPTTELTIKGIAVHAEVAATASARQKGLMYRERLPENHGMLFVFEEPGIQCFWMKNTPLPLSIAFIDAHGEIARISDMTPHDESAHCPPRDIVYALEMEQGWFKRYGVTAGTHVLSLPQSLK